MAASADEQRNWVVKVVAAGVVFLALPVLLPLLLVITPLLVPAGLVWLAFNKLTTQGKKQGVTSSSSVSQLAQAQPEGPLAPVANSAECVVNRTAAITETAPANVVRSASPVSSSSSSTASTDLKVTNPTSGKSEPRQQSAAPATGSAALLARIRAQRSASAKGASSGDAPNANGGVPKQAQEVIIAYASQTGTAQEIARNIQAESSQHGIQSKVLSFNELGMDSLMKPNKQIVVMVVSSTGEGDPPDNSARFYGHSKRRSLSGDALKHVTFTCLGLGDSNYTRYMGVPRAFKGRFGELGAGVFYPHMEADEVDGLEEFVDKWIAGLWAPLKAAALGITRSGASAEAATEEAAVHGNAALSQAAGTASQPPDLPITKGQSPSANALTPEAQAAIPKGQDLPTAPGSAPLKGVPALPECRVKILVETDQHKAGQTRQAESLHPTEAEAVFRDSEGMYSPEQPFWAVVSDARALSSADSDRQVLHVEFNIEGSGMQYQPGDSVGLLPHNSPELVQGVLQHLGQDGSQVFSIASTSGDDSKLLQHLHWPCSLQHALSVGCDLTSIPRKSLLRLLGEHCSSAEDKQGLLHLSSVGGRRDYSSRIMTAQPSLLDLFHQFPSTKPPLAALLDCLPPLAPRMYSVSCSPLEAPNAVQVAFSVVRYETPVGIRHGVATNWLQGLCQPIISRQVMASEAQIKVALYLRRGGSFGPPVQPTSGLPNLAAPMLMIGPGTGVAPFRGFLQQRQHQTKQYKGKVGAAWLFFGCRQQHEDFLYQEDLKGFESDGVLTKLRVAFSRAQGSKVYVQDLLQQEAQDVCELLQHPCAHVYVCGDGASMAKDVHSMLASILQSAGSLSSSEATTFLAAMTKQQRYVRDIWS